MARYLDETVVERQIVPQRVLPSASILPIVGEPIGDELVDLGERQHLIPRRPDRHRSQRDVRVWRLLVAVSVSRRSWHFRSIFSADFSTLPVSTMFLIECTATFLPLPLLFSFFLPFFLSFLVYLFSRHILLRSSQSSREHTVRTECLFIETCFRRYYLGSVAIILGVGSLAGTGSR